MDRYPAGLLQEMERVLDAEQRAQKRQAAKAKARRGRR
jgi:hypothetical protein